MAARITIERILRDADDASGQSIREWKMESDAGAITIRMKHGTGFLILRPDDINQFVMDLNRAKELADELTGEMVDDHT